LTGTEYEDVSTAPIAGLVVTFLGVMTAVGVFAQYLP
jgi:hypothetical protein